MALGESLDFFLPVFLICDGDHHHSCLTDCAGGSDELTVSSVENNPNSRCEPVTVRVPMTASVCVSSSTYTISKYSNSLEDSFLAAAFRLFSHF